MNGRPVAARARSAQVLLWLAAAALVALVARGIVASPIVGVLAVGAIVATVLALERRVLALIWLTTAALVVGSSSLPIASSPPVFYGKFAAMAVLGATAFTWVLDPAGRGSISRPFALAFLGLIGLALLSSLWSVDPSVTAQHAASLFLLWIAVALAVPLWMRRGDQVLTALRGLGLIAAATVLVGPPLDALGVLDASPLGRFQSLFVNPNTIGYFMAPVLPALVLMTARESGRRRNVLGAAAAVITVGLVLSGSRGGLVAAVVGTLAGMAASRGGRRGILVALLVAGVAGGFIAAREAPIRPGGEGVLEVGAGSYRLEAWPDAVGIVAQRPWLGYGFATTPIVYPEERDPTIFAGFGTSFGRVHNSTLEAAIDLGWPGAAFLLVLQVSGLMAAWRLARTPNAWQPVGPVLVAGIAGGIVEGVFESGLLAAGGLLAFPFWLLVAVAHALRARVAKGAPAEVRPAEVS